MAKVEQPGRHPEKPRFHDINKYELTKQNCTCCEPYLQAVGLGGDHFDRVPLESERGFGGLFQPQVSDLLQHGRHLKLSRVTLSPPLIRSLRRHASGGVRYAHFYLYFIYL